MPSFYEHVIEQMGWMVHPDSILTFVDNKIVLLENSHWLDPYACRSIPPKRKSVQEIKNLCGDPISCLAQALEEFNLNFSELRCLRCYHSLFFFVSGSLIVSSF